MNKHLYSTEDVKKVREELLKEQGGKDLLTGIPIPPKQAVCDHDHKTQYVRGILHRQTNAVLGKIENLWVRYLAYWYDGTLQDFLRKAADYLDRQQDLRYIHPAWIKRIQTDFRALSEGQKTLVLTKMKQPDGKNSKERIEVFKKAVLTKKYTFDTIRSMIKEAKENA